MNVLQSLQALSNYPTPVQVITNAAQEFGLDLMEDADMEVRSSAEYKRAKASVYEFLSAAPNVSQGGISFSLTDKDKAYYRSLATAIMQEVGAESPSGVSYGYQGENL